VILWGVLHTLFLTQIIVLFDRYCTDVIFSTCLVDFWEASLLSDEERYGVSRAVLWSICVLNFAFTLMQLNWGVLVVKQIMKALGFTSSKGDQTKAD
jgi:hypothetical protein